MVAREPCLMLAQEIIFSPCECQPGLDASNYKHVFIEQPVSHAVTIVGIARSRDQSHPFQVPALRLWHSRLWRQNWNFQLAYVVGLQLGETQEKEDAAGVGWHGGSKVGSEEPGTVAALRRLRLA